MCALEFVCSNCFELFPQSVVIFSYTYALLSCRHKESPPHISGALFLMLFSLKLTTMKSNLGLLHISISSNHLSEKISCLGIFPFCSLGNPPGSNLGQLQVSHCVCMYVCVSYLNDHCLPYLISNVSVKNHYFAYSNYVLGFLKVGC